MKDFGEFGLSEAQLELSEVAQSFCAARSPISKVRALIDDETGYDDAVWREIAELGWLGVAILETFGGAGLELGDAAPIVEEMGRRLMASPYVPTLLAAEAILRAGSEGQQKTLLPGIAAGAPATLALDEPEGGWDLTKPGAAAARAGGNFRLTGVKRFVSFATAASLIIVSVQINDEPALLALRADDIPKDAFRRETVIDETRRSFEINLNGVEVPSDRLLDGGDARAALAHAHLAANLLASAELVGGVRGAIDETIEYLKTRKQFGRPIGSYQALKHPTVNAFLDGEQARSHLYAAAHSFDRQGAGEIAVRMAKASALDALSFAADRAIQFHGGFGFTYDCNAHLYRRRAIWHASQFGDAAYHRRKLADLILN